MNSKEEDLFQLRPRIRSQELSRKEEKTEKRKKKEKSRGGGDKVGRDK